MFRSSFRLRATCCSSYKILIRSIGVSTNTCPKLGCFGGAKARTSKTKTLDAVGNATEGSQAFVAEVSSKGAHPAALCWLLARPGNEVGVGAPTGIPSFLFPIDCDVETFSS